MKAADIDIDSWEEKSSDLATWRKRVYVAVETVEWKRKEKYLDGWRKRHPSHFDNYAIVIDGQPMMMMKYHLQQDCYLNLAISM